MKCPARVTGGSTATARAKGPMNSPAKNQPNVLRPFSYAMIAAATPKTMVINQ
jgi:hypothetical protein